MTTLTIPQAYNLLRSVGFGPTQAADMVGIAIAESGLRTDAIGDVNLENATYGPSVGLFQVRTVKAQYGSGATRDEKALLASPLTQAQAAYEISNGGKNFSPWSTWLHGSAQAQLAKVYSALGAGKAGSQLPSTANAAPIPSGGSSATSPSATNAGLLSAPLGWLGDLLGIPGASAVESGAVKIVLFGGVLVAGVSLFVLGAWRSVAPVVKPEIEHATQGVQQAGQMASQIGAVA